MPKKCPLPSQRGTTNKTTKKNEKRPLQWSSLVGCLFPLVLSVKAKIIITNKDKKVKKKSGEILEIVLQLRQALQVARGAYSTPRSPLAKTAFAYTAIKRAKQ